jgi:predicted O-methyltransferase YrrM
MRSRATLALAGAVLIGGYFAATGQRRSFGRASSEGLPAPRTESEKRILGVLEAAAKRGELYANVPVSDGRMLRVLAESAGAKTVVEIGTSTGLSGLWFALALEKTGGKLITFEIDPGRAATARGNFKEAGVDRLVTLIEGDAHQNVARVKEQIDVVFLDADKEGYVDYLNKLLPQVRPGGLILAHNVDMIPDYLRQVSADPNLETVYYMDGGGLAITLKKRL